MATKTKKRKAANRKLVKATTSTVVTKPETALVIRTCDANLGSRNGFVWPAIGPVACKDWKPTAECGNGLHGLLWGEGNPGLLDWGVNAKWLVVEVVASDIVDLGQKVKFPRGVVVYCGDAKGAGAFVCADPRAAGKRVVSGTATAGDSGTATAGYRGTATAGYRGTATAGYRGTACAGEEGVISIVYFDPAKEKYRRIIAVVGENGVKPNVKYRVTDCKLVEAKD